MSSPVSMTYILCHRSATFVFETLNLAILPKDAMLYFRDLSPLLSLHESLHWLLSLQTCRLPQQAPSADGCGSAWLDPHCLCCMEKFMAFCAFQFVPRHCSSQDFAFYLISKHKTR